MTQTAANVDVGVNGMISVAPLGTALPTTVFADLNVLFVDVGYVDEAGVNESQPTDTSAVNAWGGDKVRDNQTSHALEFDFTMLETSDLTLELFYGDKDVVSGVQLPSQAWVIDWYDGDKLRRYCIPNARIISRSEVTINSKVATAYGVKLSCYPDAEGNKAYRYRDEDGVS